MGAAYFTFEDQSKWAGAVTDALVEDIRAALREHRQALVAVAGGRTPGPILARLARADLPWSRVSFIPTDDRLVPEEHPARNVALLRQWLSPAVAAGARVMSLEELKGEVAPHAVLLGFGADCHIASLFPNAEGVDAALALNGKADLVRVTPQPLPPEAPFPRITLTLKALVSPRRILIAAAGAEKATALEKAQMEDAKATPLAALLAQDRTPVSAYIRQ
ncbi:MAG: 6-phosphogluconolactonase [Alphaproteobacteria bacterium]|jgi:6-phosphogluconolactonase|nr:6-phosphogluconolactonase [Alphaproteobacteria bacterium]